ncbi:YVTN repeat-like/Quino protein amine dehydrogenase [Trametes coccinea BRFM310]|uniref:YVTN repeat-like/Quino protein amine dehydrogenase n=1 Tax=Trametes coccinea (strain BRFM310) TaxID=1353009 RepID=A0A1Y2IHW6_TRAC3|nr:YVTN repeat-like/Quino protein amine dehydrogenase [Trametes coccinea BRFM310]
MSAFYAWDVYASSLAPLGKGYPLWYPDPDNPEWEVEVGDVGYVREGSFKHLLRTTRTAEEQQPHNMVPDDYIRFYNPNVVITGPRESITQPVLHSRAIKKLEVSGGGSVSVPTSVAAPGANIKFKCTEEKGALLLLSPKGEDTSIQSRRHVVNHVRENAEKWENMANHILGLGLKQEDIYFVCGVTKTSRWAVAAFHGSQRDAEGSISCDLTALASANFTMSITNLDLPNCMHRAGPPKARRNSHSSSHSVPLGMSSSMGSSTSVASYATAPELVGQFMSGYQYSPTLAVPASGVVPDKADQCIFFHYYKMKKRFWPLPARIEAGAGPHQLPPGDGGMDGYSEVIADDGSVAHLEYGDFEILSHYPKPYCDPVDFVLDYILKNSEAQIAIASDLDLYTLFKTPEEYPEDVASALAEIQPTIEIDENNVGTLSVEIAYNRKRDSDVSDADVMPRKKRVITPPGHSDVAEGGNGSMDVDSFDPVESPTGSVAAQASNPPLPMTTALDEPPTEGKDIDHARVIFQGDTSGHEGSVTALAYSNDSRYLASGSEDTTIIIWHAREMSFKCRIAGQGDTITALAFFPDGRHLASASEYEGVKIWQVDARQNQQPTSLDVDSPIHSLAFTPDGTQLIGGAMDGTLIVWNLGNPEHRIHIHQHEAAITFITFSKDGRLMATGGTEQVCFIWEVDKLQEGQPKVVLRGHRGMVFSASFSHDGGRIVTASDDCSCRIWSTENGLELVRLHEHAAPVWSACFSPDGKHVTSGSSDSTVLVCDSWTGERIMSLSSHHNMVNQVVYSPDGRYIASASLDNTVRLWDARDPKGNCLTTYNEHSDNVTEVLFSPDGTRLASGSHDGKVFIRSLQARDAV